jgi:hypothetical protein
MPDFGNQTKFYSEEIDKTSVSSLLRENLYSKSPGKVLWI